jgi:spore germination cell wall hydrolase CwlJ-like protein
MTQGGAFLLLVALSAQGQQANEQLREQNQELRCMTEALYYEARGEGERGQLAVGEVVLHRAKSGRHPSTICGVVYEPYQFSFVKDGSKKRKKDQKAWSEAEVLAKRIVNGEVNLTMTRRALFYHEASIRPYWVDGMVQTAQIGRHVFYRNKPRKT